MPVLLNKYLLEALDSLQQPILILSANNDFLAANQTFCNFISPADPTHPEEYFVRLSDLVNGQSEVGLTIESKEKRVRIEVLPLQDRAKLVRIIGEAKEFSVLENLHNQRIDTLGRLAGGVAHDFNNILTGILGHVSYLKAILPKEGNHSESLSSIEEGAKRASTITQQILNFSRVDGKEKASKVDLGQVVTKTFALLRGAIHPRYQLFCEVPEEPVFVVADEGKLSQVVINLVMNAKDALKNDGEIKVALKEVNNEQLLTKILKDQEKLSEVYALFTVTDNGQGMSEEIKEKIFEPYFTTKKQHGTGLGLATVDAIIKLYGGGIYVDSVLNAGTTIEVAFPVLVEEKTKEKKSKEAVKRIEGGDERILIIDDEAPVRNVLSVSLEHLGYTVETASSGVEGIQKYQNTSPKFDIVLLDMIMPKLSGEETFTSLKELNPDIKVLIISGYAAPEAIQSILDRGGRGFVPKPFSIEELARRVRDALDEE